MEIVHESSHAQLSQVSYKLAHYFSSYKAQQISQYIELAYL